MTNSQSFFYPNRMGRIILLSMEEVMGRIGLNAILKLASLPSFLENYPSDDAERSFPFSTVSSLTDTLEQFFGPHGGRGVALRIGRACFNNGIRQYAAQSGVAEMSFKLLPLPVKVSEGAKAFAELFNTFTDQKVHVEAQGNTLLWQIERCPLCWGRHTQEPVCHLAVGVLQEALYWLSGGKVFNVEERACIAAGDPACTLVIDQTPIF